MTTQAKYYQIRKPSWGAAAAADKDSTRVYSAPGIGDKPYMSKMRNTIVMNNKQKYLHVNVNGANVLCAKAAATLLWKWME